jgi:hypothetical protein
MAPSAASLTKVITAEKVVVLATEAAGIAGAFLANADVNKASAVSRQRAAKLPAAKGERTGGDNYIRVREAPSTSIS